MRDPQLDISSLDPLSQLLWRTVDQAVIVMSKQISELADLVGELALAVWDMQDGAVSERSDAPGFGYPSTDKADEQL